MMEAMVNLHSLVKLVPQSVKIHVLAFQEWNKGEPELHLLSVLCDSDAISIDVGANRGVYTYFLHKYSRKVFAIEANPFYATRIRAAFGSSVSVIQAAASNQAGLIELWIPLEKNIEGMATVERLNPVSDGECTSVSVDCVTIDSLDPGKIGFIKIDVEGHELAVLEGARALLARDAPTLLIEAEDRHRPDAVASVRRFLADLDYEGLFLLEGKLHSMEEFDIATYQNSDLATDGHGATAGAPYINNLVFVSRNNGAARERIASLRVA
jgi:FkbM family methyltransferase